MSRRETFQSIGEWAIENFGPADWDRAIERAEEEFDELVEAGDIESALFEAADVVITLAAFAAGQGQDLQNYIDDKMDINRKRKWRSKGDGTGYHIKEDTNDDS